MMILGFVAKVMMATLILISKLKSCEEQVRGSVRGTETEGELLREAARGSDEGREPGLTGARALVDTCKKLLLGRTPETDIC